MTKSPILCGGLHKLVSENSVMRVHSLVFHDQYDIVTYVVPSCRFHLSEDTCNDYYVMNSCSVGAILYQEEVGNEIFSKCRENQM